MPKYECDNCGACCRALIVEVYEIDLLREPKLHQHVEPYNEPDSDGHVGLLACGHVRPCAFLTDANECAIYPSRPIDCLLLEPGDEQCQYARGAAGLPPLLPLPEPGAEDPD